MWIYSYIFENILFEYPLPLSIKLEQNIFNIYQKIYFYINELKNLSEDLNLTNDINYKNEKNNGFVIYINNDKIEKIKEVYVQKFMLI